MMSCETILSTTCSPGNCSSASREIRPSLGTNTYCGGEIAPTSSTSMYTSCSYSGRRSSSYARSSVRSNAVASAPVSRFSTRSRSSKPGRRRRLRRAPAPRTARPSIQLRTARDVPPRCKPSR